MIYNDLRPAIEAVLDDLDAWFTPATDQHSRNLHRGDMTAVRRELVAAQRLRPSLTYAYPYFAVQARIELTRVHLALGLLEG